MFGTFANVRIGLAFVILIVAGCTSDSTSSKATIDSKPSHDGGREPATSAVELTIDFANGQPKQRFSRSVPAKATVHDVLVAVLGTDQIESTGSGERLLIVGLNGVKNGGAGKPNWTFRVNGKLGDRSCAVFPIADGNQIDWVLGAYQPDEEQSK